MSIIGAAMVPHPPLIVPEVGKGEEKVVAKTIQSYKKVADLIAELKPETIVISSPHTVMYSDYFHISPRSKASGDFADFGAPQVKIQASYDQEFVAALSKMAEDEDFPAGTRGERDPDLDHATMLPLYFIQQKYQDFQLVRMGLSAWSLPMHYQLGMMVQAVAEDLDRRVFFVGSGDLSHRLQKTGPYGFHPAGPKYDKRIMEVMGSGQFGQLMKFPPSLLDQAGECGHRSFTIMAGALDRKDLEIEELSHEGVTGVGYGVCTYKVLGDDPSRDFLDQWKADQAADIQTKRSNEDPYMGLARKAIETYLRTRQVIGVPKNLPDQLTQERAGAFVTLNKDGQLRGCIGTIQPVQDSLAEEIIQNAISAATGDPRFPTVRVDELDSLEYSVDVLGEMEAISSIDQLDPQKYGLVVSRGVRRGVLLPRIDGVDTASQQLAIAKRKAGIPPSADVDLSRFEVVRHD